MKCAKQHSNTAAVALAGILAIVVAGGMAPSQPSVAQGFQDSNPRVWQIELMYQIDIDGDGHIGPPPVDDDKSA